MGTKIFRDVHTCTYSPPSTHCFTISRTVQTQRIRVGTCTRGERSLPKCGYEPRPRFTIPAKLRGGRFDRNRLHISYIVKKTRHNFQVITSRLKRCAPPRTAVRASGKGILRSVYAQATVQCPWQTEGGPSCSAACLPNKWRLVLPRIQH